jgi:hypothetical protein
MRDDTGFIICGTCGDLFQTEPSEGFPTPQRCGCDRKEADDPKWERHDFNEHLHLCRCCRAETCHSGSRWSQWFCDECRLRVIALNRAVGRYVIPIGRHSIMAGVAIHGPAVADADAREVDRLLAGFHAGITGLIGGIDRLWEASTTRSDELRAGLGFEASQDVPLHVWLAAWEVEVERHPACWGKLASFRALVRAFGDQAAPDV